MWDEGVCFMLMWAGLEVVRTGINVGRFYALDVGLGFGHWAFDVKQSPRCFYALDVGLGFAT